VGQWIPPPMNEFIGYYPAKGLVGKGTCAPRSAGLGVKIEQ
jgi:hypothetical protein